MTDLQPNAAEPSGPQGVPGRLSVSTQQTGDNELLSVSGEVDLSTASGLRDAIAKSLAAAPAVLVVDMTAVTFMGSAGLTVLVEAQQRSAPDTKLRIAVAHRAVLRSINITGLDRYLAVYPTVEQALVAS
ncbi:MAG TPA: STAS domain-containing protein [Pseudonocardiaceae bacterium]|nr:STAS domain-containing protein [Pseudonocardiaceae bacterium]